MAALKKGELKSDLVELDFADVKVANAGFKPLVREAKFDLGELAIVTYLQARMYDKPYVLMPAVVVGRGQQDERRTHHEAHSFPRTGHRRRLLLPGRS